MVNKALKKPPPPTDNFALESFISKLQNSIINPHILKCNIPDNLRKEERTAIFEIKNWDDRIVRLQDKGSRFVVMDRKEYCNKVINNMKSGGHHKTTLDDPTQKYVKLVSKWAAKWERANQIGEDVINFVCTVNAKLGNVTGLIKSHKEGYPLRVAIENLSAFTEYYLAPFC